MHKKRFILCSFSFFQSLAAGKKRKKNLQIMTKVYIPGSSLKARLENLSDQLMLILRHACPLGLT
jgi:hypothetical protein